MWNELHDIITVVPYSDIRKGHDFLVDVLGFESGGLVEADGRIVHGEVRAGGRRIWLHEAGGALVTPAQTALAPTAGVVVHVADVDAHFAHVKERGGSILSEPTDQDYGQREYGVADPDGHPWYIATPIDS